MKEVIKYKAEDGTLFDTKESALAQDDLNDLGNWYDENKLYGNIDGCSIDWQDFIQWCRENKSMLDEILKALRKLKQ